MDIVKGTVVISKAGRDKGRMLAVLGLENDIAIVADGDLRKIERPKRKKVKHLSLTKTVFDQSVLVSNKLLRESIEKIKSAKEEGY